MNFKDALDLMWQGKICKYDTSKDSIAYRVKNNVLQYVLTDGKTWQDSINNYETLNKQDWQLVENEKPKEKKRIYGYAHKNKMGTYDENIIFFDLNMELHKKDYIPVMAGREQIYIDVEVEND